MKTYAKITAGDVLRYIIGVDVMISPYPRIVSTADIANRLNTSKYQAKKALDRLRRQGFVILVSEYFSPYGDEEGFPVRGFTLTDKARKDPFYEMMLNKENDRINSILEETNET